VKILMRKTFVDSSPASNLNFEVHSLEEEKATIASPNGGGESNYCIPNCG
jgi:hypothetical protein